MLIPLEIVAKILSYLDTLNLLNCRLVSHSWNEECLLALKKKTVTVHLTLDEGNIQRFLDFVTADSAKPTQLKPTSCFEWKFNVDVCDGLAESRNRDVFNEFASKVNSLLNLLGPESVDKLTLANNYSSTEEEEDIPLPNLIEFFSSMSAGLSQVTFRGSLFQGIPASACGKFPKLKSIKFTNKWVQVIPSSTTNAIDFFGLDNMEHLEEFKVGADEDYWYPRLSFQKLTNLEIVDMRFGSDLLVSLSLTPTPPILRKFSCELPQNDFLLDQVLTILTSLRSTLKSIKLIIKPTCESVMLPLPRLPHLQKFRIGLGSFFDGPMSIIPETYYFTPLKLPALEKVDLPIGYHFGHGAGAELPTVVRVTLRLRILKLKNLQTQTTPTSMKENVENLQGVFPNLRSMTVVRETLDDLAENQAMKNLLLGIMESSRGSSLQELVIRNGDEDFKHSNYLGEILAELNLPVSITLPNFDEGRLVTKEFEEQKFQEHSQTPTTTFIGIRNVKTIRFEQFSSHADEHRRQRRRRAAVQGEEYEHPAPPPLTPSRQEQQLLKNRSEIGLLVQHFPQLVQLEMSPPFFGQTNKLSCFAEIQELAIAFPTLTIKLI